MARSESVGWYSDRHGMTLTVKRDGASERNAISIDSQLTRFLAKPGRISPFY